MSCMRVGDGVVLNDMLGIDFHVRTEDNCVCLRSAVYGKGDDCNSRFNGPGHAAVVCARNADSRFRRPKR